MAKKRAAGGTPATVALTGMSVADPVEPSCAAGSLTIAPGASTFLFCSTNNLTSDVTNSATATAPPDHPWRVVAPGTKLYRRKQQERRLSESMSS